MSAFGTIEVEVTQSTPQPSCPSGFRNCLSGPMTCLPISAFCNGRFDCADRSDESDSFCAG
ncbi:unnamed protein product [Protopolystoma xenopodis]|uniref:Uncharacterized protein n=1 Tax=Protopolystoma xenopodis TaxID=117903 RepID=A0A448XSD3_9PLAT|nr:unnamed protein product [Protopolystoma xenopodis]